jgi:hypothetical protein
MGKASPDLTGREGVAAHRRRLWLGGRGSWGGEALFARERRTREPLAGERERMMRENAARSPYPLVSG